MFVHRIPFGTCSCFGRLYDSINVRTEVHRYLLENVPRQSIDEEDEETPFVQDSRIDADKHQAKAKWGSLSDLGQASDISLILLQLLSIGT